MEEPRALIPVVQKAADHVGGVTKLAEGLGISRAALYNWDEVPPLRVLPIERLTGGVVTRHEMRADIYPIEAAGPALARA